MDNHEKDKNDNLEEIEKIEEKEVVEQSAEEDTESEADTKDIKEVLNELSEKNKLCEEYLDKLKRNAAEFDNYKKRTLKEKEGMYNEGICDAISAILPVIDSMDRAVKAAQEVQDVNSLREGIELVYKQIKDSLSKLGVEYIETEGKAFDPEVHNAVMHVEDENYGENIIIEEFQRGYKLKDKVIRHSMVKVAN